MCKHARKLQKSYIQICNLQQNIALFTGFIGRLFQFGNIQNFVLAYCYHGNTDSDFINNPNCEGKFADIFLKMIIFAVVFNNFVK